jgi:Lrp/AsnC ligand binding domain
MLADQLVRLPAVSHVVLTAGSFDAVIEVACANDDALLDLADHELRVLPGVLSIEIVVLLKVLKQHGRRVPAHSDAGDIEDGPQVAAGRTRTTTAHPVRYRSAPPLHKLNFEASHIMTPSTATTLVGRVNA